MENGVFWDIEMQFVPHRQHITSPPQSTTGNIYVRETYVMPQPMLIRYIYILLFLI
jgi:hypothetical protein